MELEKLAPIFAILLALGVIFGSFAEFASGGSFGFNWFVKMLWFVIGFPVLIIIGLLIWSYAQVAEAKLAEKAE
jgi:protein-S-isoprenylcysteine O-methyltransferase Ste14